MKYECLACVKFLSKCGVDLHALKLSKNFFFVIVNKFLGTLKNWCSIKSRHKCCPGEEQQASEYLGSRKWRVNNRRDREVARE